VLGVTSEQGIEKPRSGMVGRTLILVDEFHDLAGAARTLGLGNPCIDGLFGQHSHTP
jgi:hypothetical protein